MTQTLTQPRSLTAYMPLTTHPEAAPDEAIRGAIDFALGLGGVLRVTAFAVDVPQVSSPLGNLLIDVQELVRKVEEKSRAEARRLCDLVKGFDAPGKVAVAQRVVVLGAVPDAAAAEARSFDLSVLPWWAGADTAQDLVQGVVFGSGRPAIIVPAFAHAVRIDHVAIAWDGSRVAARALGDVLPLLAPGGRVSVLTVTDEKPLGAEDVAGPLVTALQGRGITAAPVRITLAGRSIGAAFQETAMAEGAGLLAMGGFGHSRFRDFILGGATKAVLAQLSMPVLLSH